MDVDTRLQAVLDRISAAERSAGRASNSVDLVAVTKTFDAEHIRPALVAGHRIFGENRVQESQGKWPALKQEFPDVQLHLIGPLQSNKSADAVALFDVIHTIDREKIAKTIAEECRKQGRTLQFYVQVNTGLEEQKAGVSPDQLVDFVAVCRDTYGLDIVGLMCIPPFDENPGPHFALLRNLAEQADVDKLSMGMSGDFETAIEFGSTSVRIGSAIFGNR